jgi:hypothetical protein
MDKIQFDVGYFLEDKHNTIVTDNYDSTYFSVVGY